MKFLTIVLMCVAITNNVAFADSRYSVGFGAQFGGLVGFQGSNLMSRSSLRWSLGVMGIATAYDRFVTEKITAGAMGFFTIFGEGAGLSLNYHFTGIREAGWYLGWDVYAAKSDLSSASRRNNYNSFTFISFGYKF